MNNQPINIPFALSFAAFATVAIASVLFVFVDGLLYVLDETQNPKIRLLTLPMIAVGVALLHAAYSALMHGWLAYLGVYLIGLIALSVLV